MHEELAAGCKEDNVYTRSKYFHDLVKVQVASHRPGLSDVGLKIIEAPTLLDVGECELIDACVLAHSSTPHVQLSFVCESYDTVEAAGYVYDVHSLLREYLIFEDNRSFSVRS